MRLGNAPRRLSIQGPPRYNEDFGISKIFPIWETVQFELGAQMLNVFKRTNRGNPNGNVSSPNFGLSFPGGGVRTVQVETRINF